MSLTVRQRMAVEGLLFTLARALELVDILRAAIEQVRDFLVHLRLGGDPEAPRHRWLTREQVKAQYRRGGSETRPQGK